MGLLKQAYVPLVWRAPELNTVGSCFEVHFFFNFVLSPYFEVHFIRTTIFILFTGKSWTFSASYLTSFQATQEADGFNQALRSACFHSGRFLLEKLLLSSIILLQGVLNSVGIYGEMIH